MLRRTLHNCSASQHPFRGQAIIEFTFSMVIVFIIFYSTIKIFEWSGIDMVKRRVAHDTLMTTNIEEAYQNLESSPLKQIDTIYTKATPMNAIWVP